VLTLPNLVTFARLLAVPVFAVLHARGQASAALWVFVGAGLSDGIDGLLARVLDQRSRLGALLDPAADKLLLTTATVALTLTGELPGWFLAVALGREGLLVLGALLVLGRGRQVPAQPSHLGKYAVFCQLAAVGLGLASRLPGWGGVLAAPRLAAVLLAAECMVLSAALYARQFGGLLGRAPET
jgi:cardiolipin synthase